MARHLAPVPAPLPTVVALCHCGEPAAGLTPYAYGAAPMCMRHMIDDAKGWIRYRDSLDYAPRGSRH